MLTGPLSPSPPLSLSLFEGQNDSHFFWDLGGSLLCSFSPALGLWVRHNPEATAAGLDTVRLLAVDRPDCATRGGSPHLGDNRPGGFSGPASQAEAASPAEVGAFGSVVRRLWVALVEAPAHDKPD